ncbi:protein translocase subunit SecF [Agrococcus sp. ARC_14]|uniref:protein translocase subunit SecF n=1 Tax=Agrococcus sp. ARC_14 TaxID=2919927 RepID=UPI001F06532E|nr:protein translocase subunit SecF [Agrococcus sp. ARC_14]MCH1883059.1 protein translocase subunit SecF [Agrococcus sp. ARC_14]
MASLTTIGNELYTGERSVPVVPRRKLWFMVTATILIVLALGTVVRGGFVFGIEFTGGSEFRVSGLEQATTEGAAETVEAIVPDTEARVATIGPDTLRVQTDAVTEEQAAEIRGALAEQYGVETGDVAFSFIGPSWGQDVSRQALLALVVFLGLVSVVLAVYFRTWKMSIAALASLAFDLLVTAGVYGIIGFEVTPAAVIGFLTILGYSLYDTVVVFDKVRENTAPGSSGTMLGQINLAVNQTIVRSINTSIVATLPIASILFIGAFALGAGTLRDIALALFIGTIVGTWSSIFVAAPVYAQLRQNDDIGDVQLKQKRDQGAVV